MDMTSITAQELRAQAQRARQRSEDSFQRSDTDGFLTQWASDLQASLLEEQANIVERGHRARFQGLYQGDRRVKARLIDGQFGMCWILEETEAALFGRKFIPITGVGPSAKQSRVQKRLGLRERMEWAPAWARMAGTGRGLSGTCYVSTYRKGDPWGQDAILDQDDAS